MAGAPVDERQAPPQLDVLLAWKNVHIAPHTSDSNILSECSGSVQ